jgi:hypothetical protein
MNKAHILSEIKRAAAENGGKPPGVDRFRTETGIRQHEWGQHWVRWSEALADAGFAPNALNARLSDDEVMGRLAALARELGHFPVTAEVRIKKRSDPTFPNAHVFYKRGGLPALRAKLREYCLARGEEDVAALCGEVTEHEPAPRTSKAVQKPEAFVYLMKSGRRYKIGRSKAVGRREYDLGILLPDPPRTLHKIRTDDPIGIEAYWHGRFADKRRRDTEFFDLTADDVAAFKRRKFM